MPSRFDWVDYYGSVSGRTPRPLLMAALSLFPHAGADRRALDVGCGDGTESLMLLAHGWHVLAIDRQPEAIELLHSRVPAEDQPRLRTQVAAFRDIRLEPADLVLASYSLPFCAPADFPALWHGLTGALRPGGIFACHLLGVRDAWAGQQADADEMTFHTAQEVASLLAGLELPFMREFEDDQPACSGPKHWHIFEIIARRTLDT